MLGTLILFSKPILWKMMWRRTRLAFRTNLSLRSMRKGSNVQSLIEKMSLKEWMLLGHRFYRKLDISIINFNYLSLHMYSISWLSPDPCTDGSQSIKAFVWINVGAFFLLNVSCYIIYDHAREFITTSHTWDVKSHLLKHWNYPSLSVMMVLLGWCTKKFNVMEI